MLISILISSFVCALITAAPVRQPKALTRNTANRVNKNIGKHSGDHQRREKNKVLSIAPVKREGAPHSTLNAVFNGWQPYGAADASKERMFLLDKESNEYGMIRTSLKPIPALLNIG